MTRGLRKVQRAKLPKPRPGLDDPKHLAAIRAMPCLIRGGRAVIRKWVGVYPNAEEVQVEVVHVCSGPTDPHHTIRKSQRGSDWTTIPLCRAAHDLLHSMGQADFEITFDVDLVAEAARLASPQEQP